MTLELTRLQPMERNRATAKKLGAFREVLDEVNQLLALAGDHRRRLQLHDRLAAQCVIIRAVLEELGIPLTQVTPTDCGLPVPYAEVG